MLLYPISSNVILTEMYEENPTSLSHGYAAEKGVFHDFFKWAVVYNQSYEYYLILHQNSTSDRAPKIHWSVESSTLSMNFSIL